MKLILAVAAAAAVALAGGKLGSVGQIGLVRPGAKSVPQKLSLDSAGSLGRLAERIRAVLHGRSLRGVETGVKIVSVGSGQTLFAEHSSEPLTPASTMKLLTSAAAIGTFGILGALPMSIRADAEPVKGVIEGNIYIQGHGDPTFTAVDLDSLVGAIVKRGITSVDGSVVGDGSFFDAHPHRSEYSGDGENVEPMPSLSAIVIDRNAVTVVAHAGAARGEKVRVQTVPNVPAITLVSSAVTSAPRAAKPGASSGRGRRKRHGKRYGSLGEGQPEVRFAFASPGDEPPTILAVRHRRGRGRGRGRARAPRSSLRFSSHVGADGRQVVNVGGSISIGRTASYRIEIKNPALAAASMLRARLALEGVRIGGGAKTGVTPERAIVVVEKRTPLLDVLPLLNKNSDNYAAEQLFKSVGAQACRSCDDDATSGISSIQRFLMLHKLAGVCDVHDGSGLSRRSVVTPDVKVGLLRALVLSDSTAILFPHTLSVAGVDGTLKHRMRGTSAEGNLHAKTGTLRNVSALAGYVQTRDGELLAFDITMNLRARGSSVHACRTAQDKIGQMLAEYQSGR